MTRSRRVWTWLGMALSGATLFQVPNYGVGFTTGYPDYGVGTPSGVGNLGSGGCARFATNGLASSVDFCYLLDCDNGFFGGLVSPCGDPNSSADNYLVDCPGGPMAIGTTAGQGQAGGAAQNNNQQQQAGVNANNQNNNANNNANRGGFGGMVGG